MGSLAHCWHKGLLFTIPFYLLLTLALLPISLADSPDNYKLSGPVVVLNIFLEWFFFSGPLPGQDSLAMQILLCGEDQ